MQYKIHLATTLVVAMPIMAATDSMTSGAIVAVSLGALLPDIDEPNSYIGSRTRGVSDLFSAVFGHRGLTHSLLFFGIVLILALIPVVLNFIKPITAFFFLFGYLLHLIEDSFSKSGIAWLQPFKNKNYNTGCGVIYYTTGSIVEKLIFIVMLLLLLLEFKVIGLSALIDNIRSIINNLMSFIQNQLQLLL